MQDAIFFANDLMDQKIHTFAERQAKNKRKLDNNSSKSNTQQPPFKRRNVARVYSVGSSEKKSVLGFYCCATSASFTTMARALSDCPESKNWNHGNQDGGTEARRMVYTLEGEETDQDLDNIEDDINA
nr:hypothetical protein [Tanacetum cinerariifolium]